MSNWQAIQLQVDRGLPTSMDGDETDAAAHLDDEPDWFLSQDTVNKMKNEELKDAIRRRGVVLKVKRVNFRICLGNVWQRKYPSSRADLTKMPLH